MTQPNPLDDDKMLICYSNNDSICHVCTDSKQTDKNACWLVVTSTTKYIKKESGLHKIKRILCHIDISLLFVINSNHWQTIAGMQQLTTYATEKIHSICTSICCSRSAFNVDNVCSCSSLVISRTLSCSSFACFSDSCAEWNAQRPYNVVGQLSPNILQSLPSGDAHYRSLAKFANSIHCQKHSTM